MEDWSWMDGEPDLYDGEDPEGNRVEAELDKVPVEKFDDKSGDLAGPFGGWNTIPFGAPADCRRRLLVVINSDFNIARRLRAAERHLKRCDGTHGVKTISVTFYLTGFFPSWQEKWIDHRARLEAALGPQQRGQPPIIRICVRGRPYHTFFTSEGRPAGGRTMLEWWRKADPHVRGHLRKRLEFVRAHRVEEARSCGFVEGFTEQPLGLSGANVLSFGDYRATGAKVLDWCLRCYLVPGVPIGFPGRIKLPATPPLWVPTLMPIYENSAWVAVDAIRFLTTPEDYLDLGELP